MEHESALVTAICICIKLFPVIPAEPFMRRWQTDCISAASQHQRGDRRVELENPVRQVSGPRLPQLPEFIGSASLFFCGKLNLCVYYDVKKRFLCVHMGIQFGRAAFALSVCFHGFKINQEAEGYFLVSIFDAVALLLMFWLKKASTRFKYGKRDPSGKAAYFNKRLNPPAVSVSFSPYMAGATPTQAGSKDSNRPDTHRAAGSWKSWIWFLALAAIFLLFEFLIPLGTAIKLGVDEDFELSKTLLYLKGFHFYSEVWNASNRCCIHICWHR